VITEPGFVGYFSPDEIVPGPCVALFRLAGELVYTFGGHPNRFFQANYPTLSAFANSARETIRCLPADVRVTPEDSLYQLAPGQLVVGSRHQLRRTLKRRLTSWAGSAAEGLMVATFIGDYRLLMFWNEIAGNILSVREVDDCVRLGRPPLGLKPEHSSLRTVEYYQRLFMSLAVARTRICAISLMGDPEWTDSALERRFLELTLEAAHRGVEIYRVFVMSEQTLQQSIGSVPALRAHCRGEGPSSLRGFVIPPETINTTGLGDGFIAFDDDVVVVDAFENGHARGKISKNSSDVARLLALHQYLRERSEELTVGMT
jgi:hypothetical protein